MGANNKNKIPVKKPKNTAKVKNEVKKTLTDKEYAFVIEYMKDFNGTQACIRSGYSTRSAFSQACRMLKKDYIQNAIKELKEERRVASDIQAEDIIADCQNIKELALSEQPVIVFDRKTQKHVATGEVKLDLKAALKAVELSGKVVGAFSKDNETDNKHTIINVNVEAKDLEKVVKKLKEDV